MRVLTAWVLVAMCTLSCGLRGDDDDTPSTPAPNIEPIEEILGSAVPLAYAATLAIASMKGANLPCVAVTLSCATPPCSAKVTIALNADCVLPLGTVGNGAIIVNGFWTSDSSATLTAIFEGVTIGVSDLWVRQGAFVASLRGDTIVMAYGDQDVSVTGTRDAAIAQSGWSVSVQTNGTLADVSDDRMVINGTREYVSTAQISDVVLTGVTMRGTCALNPVAGTASMVLLAVPPGVTALSFHNACDGKADVTASSSVQWIGKPIPLSLLN